MNFLEKKSAFEQMRILVILAICCGVGLQGCLQGIENDDPSEMAEIRVTKQALTSNQSQILSFETPTDDWYAANSALLGMSGVASEGSAAISVSPNGWTMISSTPLSSLGQAGNTASLDVRLPQQVNWGEVRLVFSIPSQNIWWLDVGGQALSNLSANNYHTLSFPLDANAQSLLSSEYNDLKIRVVLNAPALSSPYLFDNLVLVENSSPDTGSDTDTGDLRYFQFVLPSGVPLAETAIAASESIRIADGVTVGTLPSTVYCDGTGVTEIGADALIKADVVTVGNQFLRERAHITGKVLTRGSVTKQNSVVVNGGTTEHGDFERSDDFSWEVNIPNMGPGVNLEPDHTRNLAPGAYEYLELKSRATVRLTSGTYYFNRFQTEPQSRIEISSNGDAVVIYVINTLTNRAQLVHSTSISNFFIGYWGNTTADLDAPFSGTLVAPNALIRLAPLNGGRHKGQFIGKSINAEAHTPIDFVPYKHWSEIVPNPVNRLPIKTPRKLPKPPLEVGCYIQTIEGWVTVPCTDPEDVNLPNPIVEQYAIKADTIDDPEAEPDTDIDDPDVRTWNYPDAYEIAKEYPLEFGQLETTFVTYGGAFDSKEEYKSLSVQLNTNKFWHKSGDGSGADQNKDYLAAVQFAIQTLRGNTGICIWDVNVYEAYINPAYQYHTLCLNGVHPGALGSPIIPFRNSGDFQQFDFATIGASAYKNSAGEPVLGMVAQFSWGDPSADLLDPIDPDYGDEPTTGIYAVVAPDYNGLGLKNHWTDISGDVMGAGNGSHVDFTDSSVLTRLLAGSCIDPTGSGPVPEIPWPGDCPEQPNLWDFTRIGENSITAEGNNLRLVPPDPTEAPKEDVLKSYSKDFVYTQYLSSTSNTTIGSCRPGGQRIFVRDTPSDLGVVPSNYGGEPFWMSPDIFVVPEGTPVTVDAIAPNSVLAPGGSYDIYVRVHNDYGCDDIDGVKAKVHFADPSILSVEWGAPVTGTDYSGASAPNGISVAPGESALIGPFTWTAPSDIVSGHKCLLASIISEQQGAPIDETDAPGSYQVAQRNVQFGTCQYALNNTTGMRGNLNVILTAEGAEPSLQNGNVIEMAFDDPVKLLFNAWQNQGEDYSISNVDGKTTVRIGKRYVELPTVSLPANTHIGTYGKISLLPGEPDTTFSIEVIFSDPTTDNTIAHNGASCINGSGATI